MHLTVQTGSLVAEMALLRGSLTVLRSINPHLISRSTQALHVSQDACSFGYHLPTSTYPIFRVRLMATASLPQRL